MRNKMLMLILTMAMALLPPLAQSRDATRQALNYAELIRDAWPQSWLRVEQQRWLAAKAAEAMQACLQTGQTPVACRQQIVDSLIEVIGEEPLSKLSYTRLE